MKVLDESKRWPPHSWSLRCYFRYNNKACETNQNSTVEAGLNRERSCAAMEPTNYNTEHTEWMKMFTNCLLWEVFKSKHTRSSHNSMVNNNTKQRSITNSKNEAANQELTEDREEGNGSQGRYPDGSSWMEMSSSATLGKRKSKQL